MTETYDQRLQREWQLSAGDPTRAAIARELVKDLANPRVLDVGCGAGQELRPFLTDSRAFGVGLDLSPEAGPVARGLFALEPARGHVAFVRAAAERLPFPDSSFDVVICRVALPYTNNAEALAQMARVLRARGTLFLQFHHARYYLAKLRQALREMDRTPALYACRVLIAGCLYHVTGVQVRGRYIGGETFQTLWMLRRELARHGLEVRRVLDPASNAPRVLIERSGVS